MKRNEERQENDKKAELLTKRRERRRKLYCSVKYDIVMPNCVNRERVC